MSEREGGCKRERERVSKREGGCKREWERVREKERERDTSICNAKIKVIHKETRA